MSKIEETLAERKENYGSFDGYAEVAVSLKEMMRDFDGYSRLSDTQRESLEMLMGKVARILSGNPDYVDSWHDIAGYATLIVNELEGNHTEEVPPLTNDIVTDRRKDGCGCLFKFPTTKFAKENNTFQQLEHLKSEAQEFLDECYQFEVKKSVDTTAIFKEAVDFVHSLHTYSEINAATKERVASAIEEVIEGNKERGYYDE